MEIKCPKGVQLSSYIREKGYGINTLCGGRGNCGKCKVRVVKGELAVSTMDYVQLTAEEIEQGIRLACQAMPDDEVIIDIEN